MPVLRYSRTLFDDSPIYQLTPEDRKAEIVSRSLATGRIDPFDLVEPMVIGVSGGRSSAMQLYEFISRHGSDFGGRRVLCPFSNTGLEDEAAFRFITRQQQEWGVTVTVLEYRFEFFPDSLLDDAEFISLRQRQYENRKDKTLRAEVAAAMDAVGFVEQGDAIRQGREVMNGRPGVAKVSLDNASRNGEPFDLMLVVREQYRRTVKGLPGVLPNSANNGMCTGELKMNTVRRYVTELWGVGRAGYIVALALRADGNDDERAGNMARSQVEAGIPVYPLWEAGITADDVAAFWAKQSWGLEIPGYAGNCRNCHQKPTHINRRLIAESIMNGEPLAEAEWRAMWEKRTGDRFDRGGEPYARMLHDAHHNLFSDLDRVELPAVGSAVKCHGGYCSD